MKKHINQKAALVALISVVLSVPFQAVPLAEASSWNSTLLVNTEAFQVIDDGEAGTDIELQFGDITAQTLGYNVGLSRFDFSDDVYVAGNLDVAGTASGKQVHFSEKLTGSGTVKIQNESDSTVSFQLLDSSDSPVFNVDTINERIGIGTDTPTALLHIEGPTARIDIKDSGGGNPDIAFSQTGENNFARIEGIRTGVDAGELRFYTDDGAVQAERMRIDEDGNVLIGPTLLGGSLEVNGPLSGNTLTVSSLESCDTVDTDADGNFICGVDGGGGASEWTDVGGYLHPADGASENVIIGSTDPAETALEVVGTASGQFLHFGERLTGSGNVAIRNILDSTMAFQVFDSDGGTPVFNIDTANERVGIGTESPGANLAVHSDSTNNVLAEFMSSTGDHMLEVVEDSAGDSIIRQRNASDVIVNQFNTSGDSYITGGNLGIGTDSPDGSLHVLRNGTLISTYNSPTGVFQATNAAPTDSNVYITAGATGANGEARLIFGDTDDTNEWEIEMDNGDNNLSFRRDEADAVVFDTNGQVGIGTSSPDTHLEIVGTMSGNQLSVAGGNVAINGSGNTVFNELGLPKANLRVESDTETSMLYVDAANDSVGIGSNTPNARLDVEDTVNSEFVRLTDSSNLDSTGIFTGVGSPEGSVSAQLGSIYIDHFGGTVFKKSEEDGANTGWEPLAVVSTGAHLARMTRDASQSISSGTPNKIAFDNETFDEGGIASTTTDEFTIIATGSYIVMSSWNVNNLDGSDYMEVSIYRNGLESSTNRNHAPSNNDDPSVEIVDILYLVPGDTIEMYVEHNQGGNLDTLTAARAPRMSVAQITLGSQSGGGGGGGLEIGEADDRYVNVTGDTMSGSLTVDMNSNQAAITLESIATTEAALEIDIVGDEDSPHLLFGENGVFDTNLFRKAANVLKTNDSFYVAGTLSGSYIHAHNQFDGAGLVDCDDTLNDKLMWDQGTKQFLCDSDQNDGGGGGGATGSGYISITVDENSTASAALYDIFEDASYPGTLDYTTNASGNITFTPANGRFTIASTGTYLATLNLLPELSNLSLFDILISVNGTTVYQHDVFAHNLADPVERSVSIIIEADAGDYVEFEVDSLSASTLTAYDGTTASIHSIGPEGDGIPLAEGNRNYVKKAGDTMTGSLIIDQESNFSSFEIDSEATTQAAAKIDIAGDSDSPHLEFGQGGSYDTNLYREAADLLRTDDAFTVGGVLSGSSLSVGGATAEITSTGALSGTSVSGFGLTDCDNAGDKLVWDQSTGLFSCGTDGGVLDVHAFTDTTGDTIFDNNSTDYWDGTQPNISPTATTNEVLVMVTVSANSTTNGDREFAYKIHRDIGAAAGCTDTQIGSVFSHFTSDSNDGEPTTSYIIVDTPATTSPVNYTLCSSNETSNTSGTVTDIEFTLIEVDDLADIAEVYPTNDPTLLMGEVVSIDPNLPTGVLRSSGRAGEDVLGVVSSEPAQVIGGRGGRGITGVPIALSGRVPVRVSTENGPILPGDYLTGSSVPGVGMKATSAAPVFGRALSGYNSEGVGSVITFIERRFYPGE